MRRKFYYLTGILFFIFGLLAANASAGMFDDDDDKMALLLREVKKLNTRVLENVIPKIEKTSKEIQTLRAEISRLKSGNKNLMQQMDILVSVIPSIQESMDRGRAETNQQIQAMDKKLAQLEAHIKAGQDQVAKNQKAGMDTIKQEVSVNLKGLQDGVAKDIEKMGTLSQSKMASMEKQMEKHLNAQNTRMDKTIAVMTEIAKGGSKDGEILASLQKGLVENSKALSEQNKKIIDILSKSLKEQEAASTQINSLGGNQAKSEENIKITRETMVALKGILDTRLAEIDKTQQALQTQNDQALQNSDLIKANLLVADQKINKLAEGLSAFQGKNAEGGTSLADLKTELTQLKDLSIETDQKFTTLIDTTKSMLANASEVNQKVDSSLMKLDEGRTEIDLTSEKITKLIEILKAIAEEQGKLEQLMAAGGGEDKNKALMKALDDLRRKANVNISRSDSILKKLRGNK